MHRKSLMLVFWWFCYCKLSEGWLTRSFGEKPKADKPMDAGHCKLWTDRELDILQALNISDDMRGVRQLKTSDPGGVAWRLHTTFDHVQIPETMALKLFSQLQSQFSAEFIYRQHRKTVSTLLSINSPGKMSPWLRLTTNLKINKLFLYYRITEDNKLHEKIFDFHQHNNWSRVAFSIDKSKLTLYVNCKPPDKQQLAGNILLKFPPDSLIYFRQEPGYKKKLLGSVQVAKLSSCPLEQRPWQCTTKEKMNKL